MKIRIFCIFLCACGSHSLFADSISEIYSVAKENDYQLKSAEAAYLAGLEDVNISKADLLPHLVAQGELDQSEIKTTSVPTNPFAVRTEETNSRKGPVYSISLSQSLINFPALHRYKRGVFNSEGAELNYLDAKQKLILRVADIYLQILRLGDKYALASATEDAFRAQLQSAKVRYDAGLARVSDLLEAQAAYDSSFADVISSKNAVNTSLDRLKTITSKNYSSVFALSEDFKVISPNPIDLQKWIDSSSENNIELKLAKIKSNASYENYLSKVSERLPTLSLNVKYSDSQVDHTDNFEARGYIEQRGASASLLLSVPLYSGGSISSFAREAHYQYLKNSIDSDGASLEVVEQTKSFYYEVINGVSEINARKSAVLSSKSALVLARAGYEEGLRSIIDVLNAEKVFAQASQSYSNALYDYLIAGLKLKHSAGVLTERDIDELNLQLDTNKKISRIGIN